MTANSRAASRLASRLMGGALDSCAAGGIGGSGAGTLRLAAAVSRGPPAAAGTRVSIRGASRSAWRSFASEGVATPPTLQRRALSAGMVLGAGAAAAAGGPLRNLGGALVGAAAAPSAGSSATLAASRRMATGAAAGLGGGMGLVTTRPVAQPRNSSSSAAWFDAVLGELCALELIAVMYGACFLYNKDTVPYTGRLRALPSDSDVGWLDWLLWQSSFGESPLPAEGHPSAQLVRRVGAAVAAAACDGAGGGSWEHAKELTWESVVVDDAEPQARARPSGKVVVTTGMLDFLGVERNPENGEAALAWVLAREAAHLLARHPEDVSTWVPSPTTFCAALPGCWCFLRSNTVAGSVAACLGMLMAPVAVMWWHCRRQLQLEADVIGLHLAARAGFNPAGAFYVLQGSMVADRLEELSGRIDEIRGPLRTLCPNADRVALLAKHMPQVLADRHKPPSAGSSAALQEDGSRWAYLAGGISQ